MSNIFSTQNTNGNSEIKTDTLKILNGSILTNNESIQISNIAMIEKFDNKFTINQTETLLLIAGIILFFAYKTAGIILLAFVGFTLFLKYKKYEETKYYLLFNLGSSTNYLLPFKDINFRQKVFEVVTEAFDTNKNINAFINLEEKNIFNENSTQIKNNTGTVVTGDNNITGNNKNVNFTQGNNNSQNNTNALSELNWNELKSDLEKTLNNPSITPELKNILNELLGAVNSQNKELLTAIAKRNETELNNSFIRDILSGTIAGVLSTIFIK